MLRPQVREIASISAMIGEFEETAPDNATEIRIEAPHPKTGARREFRLKVTSDTKNRKWGSMPPARANLARTVWCGATEPHSD